jgi:3-methylcrotonyl-CoA carboxylase beta subunit
VRKELLSTLHSAKFGLPCLTLIALGYFTLLYSAPEEARVAVIETAVTDAVRASLEFKKNRDHLKGLVSQVEELSAALKLGGGEKAIVKQHEKGRLTARERIERILDPGAPFCELSLFAAHGMYGEWGGAPAAGVITGTGSICGHTFMIIANDATVKAGAFFPITTKKVIRAQTISLENRLPVLYLVDSAGVFLPLQDEVFPDQDDFGRVFYLNARLTALGVPQVAAIMGMCVAGGAYLPVMCDTLLMTDGSGLFLAGPALVKAAIGQNISSEELGGAAVHAAVSGTVDFHEKTDEACCARIREVIAAMGQPDRPVFSKVEAKEPLYPAEDLFGIYPASPVGQYDVREILARLLDGSEFTEYRPEYGRTLVCGYGRIGGWAVGIVANQKIHLREPGKPMEFGGVIYVESANKAARFILDCHQQRVPILFIHDVNGFMVGRDAEYAGIIRAGAKMVNAVSNVGVPKISVIVGGSFGAGHYAMCGKAYGPRFLFSWPTAKFTVMGADQAANTLLDIRVSQLQRAGKALTDDEKRSALEEIKQRYTAALDPKYGAARLWIDAIIDPAETRLQLIRALDVAAHNPEIAPLSVGVFQT